MDRPKLLLPPPKLRYRWFWHPWNHNVDFLEAFLLLPIDGMKNNEQTFEKRIHADAKVLVSALVWSVTLQRLDRYVSNSFRSMVDLRRSVQVFSLLLYHKQHQKLCLPFLRLRQDRQVVPLKNDLNFVLNVETSWFPLANSVQSVEIPWTKLYRQELIQA